MAQVLFHDTSIGIAEYPYPPSTCYPQRTLDAAEIVEVSPAGPVVFRLRCRDVAFVSSEQKNECIEFARRNDIPVIHRFDPWSLVLEPFLDTEYTREQDVRTGQLLAVNGISQAQCEQWRRRFRKAMLSYNFDSMLWEWGELGATDLLDAHMGKLANPKYKIPEQEFAELYRLVIDVVLGAAEVPRAWTSPGNG